MDFLRLAKSLPQEKRGFVYVWSAIIAAASGIGARTLSWLDIFPTEIGITLILLIVLVLIYAVLRFLVGFKVSHASLVGIGGMLCAMAALSGGVLTFKILAVAGVALVVRYFSEGPEDSR